MKFYEKNKLLLSELIKPVLIFLMPGGSILLTILYAPQIFRYAKKTLDKKKEKK